jgi:hypothetical protein
MHVLADVCIRHLIHGKYKTGDIYMKCIFESDRNFARNLEQVPTGYEISIRALSAPLATEFNISPDRWTAIWSMASVPTERWGEMDIND